MANNPPLDVPGVQVLAGFLWGQERYRYPENVPKVAAKGGPFCTNLPKVPYQQIAPFVVTDVGANPWKYNNPGIVLELGRSQATVVRVDRRTAAQQRPDRYAGMNQKRGIATKFGIFVGLMLVLTGCLFLIFGQYRAGSTVGYSAVFSDVSSLKAGETVRFAGVRVGTVEKIALQPDKTVAVTFDVDRDLVLTGGTHANIRYLNLVGDRYLELVDGPGPATVLPAGSAIPDGPDVARARPRPSAGRAQTGDPGSQPWGRQRIERIAHSDHSGPGRHPRLAAGQVVVVLECVGRQEPNHSAAHRQPEHHLVDPVQGGEPVLRRNRPAATAGVGPGR